MTRANESFHNLILGMRSCGFTLGEIGRYTQISRQRAHQICKLHGLSRYQHPFGLKKCCICQKPLPISEFYRNKGKSGGLSSFCKQCNTTRMREYYRNSPEKQKQVIQKYATRYPGKIRAWRIAYHSFKKSQRCSVTGCNNNGERHHPDYNSPNNIIWLCRQHHIELHTHKLDVV